MAFFTLSVDYEGGTYFSQVKAKDANEAVELWAQTLDFKVIPNVGPKSKLILLNDLRSKQEAGHNMVLINGMINVWCLSFIVRGKLMIVHVVKTVGT